MAFSRLGIVALIATFFPISTFSAAIITPGTDPGTGNFTVTQTIQVPSQGLDVVDPQSLFVFSDFASLGIANAVYVNGDTSFDVVFSNQVTSCTITNDDPVADSFSAEITSALAVDPAGTLSAGDTGRIASDLSFNTLTSPDSLNLDLAQTGSINVASGATYTGPDQLFTDGIYVNNNCGTFGDTDLADGCAHRLSDAYSGTGSVSFGLMDADGFGFTGARESGNPNLAFAGTTDYSATAEITYEYTVSDSPEPATMILCGSALIGFGLLRRRRNHK